jgi:hypothetical protein
VVGRRTTNRQKARQLAIAPGLRLFWSREMREETGFIERDSFIVGIVVKI